MGLNEKSIEGCDRFNKSIDLDGFLDSILVDDDVAKILEILKKYDITTLNYGTLKEFPNLCKCEVQFYIGNIEPCEFSFLFKYK